MSISSTLVALLFGLLALATTAPITDTMTVNKIVSARFQPNFFSKRVDTDKYMISGSMISSNGWPLYYFNLTGTPSMKNNRLDSARISLCMSSKMMSNQKQMLRFAIMDMHANPPKMSLYDIPHHDYNLVLNVTLQTRALRSKNRNILALGILSFRDKEWKPRDFDYYVEVSDTIHQPLIILETTTKEDPIPSATSFHARTRQMRNIRHNHGPKEQEPIPESEELLRPGNVLYETIKSRIEVRVFLPNHREPRLRHHHTRNKAKFLNKLQRSKKRIQDRTGTA